MYPFIVRNASLIGVDTVSTPIDERRAGVGRDGRGLPPSQLDAMVDDTIGLGGLGPALERILAGGTRGRVLVDPHR